MTRRAVEAAPSRNSESAIRRKLAWSATRIALIWFVLAGLWAGGWWFTQSTGNPTKIFSPGESFPWLEVGGLAVIGLCFLPMTIRRWREYFRVRSGA